MSSFCLGQAGVPFTVRLPFVSDSKDEVLTVHEGLPRVFEDTLPSYLRDDDEWPEPGFADFLSTTRINVSIRQVLP
jgi:hypothetical protein